MSIVRGLIGIVVLILIAFLFSKNRKAIDWKLVGVGLGLQFLLVLGMLYLPLFQQAIGVIAKVFVKVLSFSKAGATFLFGTLADGQTLGYVFVFQVFPTIIFFSALTSLLYYLNIIQWVIKGISWVLRKTLKISGAEGLVASSNIFVGVAEAPMLIKGFLPQMNPSELFLLMTAGMATIAGGVMAAYVGMLGGNDPAAQILFAKHLIAASTMAAPGAVVMSKIMIPQTERVSDVAVLSRYDMGNNMLDALANGATDGLRLSASIGAIMLVFISFN
jgi:concentrative nucleoside transporter, CNT family